MRNLLALICGVLMVGPLPAFPTEDLTPEQIAAKCHAEGGCALVSRKEVDELIEHVVGRAVFACQQEIKRREGRPS